MYGMYEIRLSSYGTYEIGLESYETCIICMKLDWVVKHGRYGSILVSKIWERKKKSMWFI